MRSTWEAPKYVQLSVADSDVWIAGVTVLKDNFLKSYSVFVPSLCGIVKSTTIQDDDRRIKVKHVDTWMVREDPKELPASYKATITTEKFRRGQILSLSVKNIRALTDIETRPSAGLNLLCNPNGTGKSSLLHALSLVFFTDVAHLDSSRSIKDFVTRGEKKAVIEVVLFDPDQENGMKNLRREIDSKGRTKLYDEGAFVTAASLKGLRENYDISLSGMNRAVVWDTGILLEQAVESLGGQCRLEELEECRADARKIDKLKAQISKKSMELKAKETKLKEMEPSVKEAEEAKDQIELKETLMYIIYHKEMGQLAADVDDANERKLGANRELQDVKRKLVSFEKRLVENHKICKEAKMEVVKAKRIVDDQEKVNEEGSEKVEQFELELKYLVSDLTARKEACISAEMEFKEAETKALEAETKFQTSLRESGVEREDEELERREKHQEQLRTKRDKLEREEIQLENEIRNLGHNIKMLENRLHSLQDVRKHRIQLLDRKSRFRGVYDCVQLVKQLTNEQQFRMNVYGPVAAEIDCNWGELGPDESAFYARLLESCVSGWYAAAFVAECDEDANVLISKCKERLNGWCPDIITRPPRDHIGLRQMGEVSENLRQLGIECVVNDIFSAPDAVRDALNAHLKLQNIYVGNEDADNNMEKLRDEAKLKTWYTPNFRYNVTHSRYDRAEVSLRIDTNFGKVSGRLYSGGNNSMIMEKKTRQNDVEQAILKQGHLWSKLKDKRRNVEDVKEEIRAFDDVVSESRKKMASHRRLKEEVALWSSRLADRRKKKEQLIERMVKVRRDIAERRRQLNEVGNTTSNNGGRLQHAKADLERRRKMYSDFTRQRRKIEELIATGEAEVVESERKLRRLTKQAKAATARLEAKRGEGGGGGGAAKLSEERLAEAKRAWAHRSMDEAQEALMRAQAALRVCSSPGHAAVIADYRALQADARAVREAVRRLEGRQRVEQRADGGAATRAHALADWLRAAVRRASARFDRMCQQFGRRGALRFIGDMSVSAGDFGLQVLIDGHALTRGGASGGEHTVFSTLLCLALDEKRPFRVMDEVGQALDDDNLKRVLNAVVLRSITDGGKCPQLLVAVPRKPQSLHHPRATCNLINAAPIDYYQG